MGSGLRFVRGYALGSKGLVPSEVGVSEGRFVPGSARTGVRDVDVTGLWLLPGIVDLHGDGFERHLAPRRGLVADLGRGLDGVEAELALNGITTAWLAQFWSWEGGMRGPEFARRLAQALGARRDAQGLDLRMQLRYEAHMVEDSAAVRDLVAKHGIDYVVINDHLPHRHLAEERTPPRLTGSALKAGRAPQEHLAEMQRLASFGPQVAGSVQSFAREMSASGVRLGSHDDPDADTRARQGAAGLRICEFPTSRTAAQAARDTEAPVIMGAPNVLRGGSHKKGVSAQTLIADGLVDALASDYHYPALSGAAFALADRGILSFAKAWALISSRPAALMGLSDRGRIAAGLRADLILLDPADRRVLGCFAAGRPVFLRGRLAEVLLG